MTSKQTGEAKTDLLIERPDLGPNVHTLILAGDEVPEHLADNKRQATKADARTSKPNI